MTRDDGLYYKGEFISVQLKDHMNMACFRSIKQQKTIANKPRCLCEKCHISLQQGGCRFALHGMFNQYQAAKGFIHGIFQQNKIWNVMSPALFLPHNV